MQVRCVFWILGLAIALLTGSATASAAPWRYSVLDVGTLGGDTSRPSDLNDRGQLVGVSEDSFGVRRPFRTGENRAIVPSTDELPGLDGFRGGVAMGINNHGEVVGYLRERGGSGLSRAVLWDEGGGSLVWVAHGQAYAINDRGDIVGYRYAPLGEELVPSPYLRTWDGTDVALGSFGREGYPMDLDEGGLIVGFSSSESLSSAHAVVWEGRHLEDLGTLGGTYSDAMGVNEAGLVVGTSTDADGLGHAFVEFGGFEALPSPVPGIATSADAINDMNQIVGGYATHAAYWQLSLEGAEVVDLNERIDAREGWLLRSAVAINRWGQIAVEATRDGGLPRALVLTPVRMRMSWRWAGDPGRVRVRVSGAEPGASVSLFYGVDGYGEREDPWIHGVILGVRNPRPAAQAIADADGIAEFDVVLPTSPAGSLSSDVVLQAVHRGNVSNLADVREPGDDDLIPAMDDPWFPGPDPVGLLQRRR